MRDPADVQVAREGAASAGALPRQGSAAFACVAAARAASVPHMAMRSDRRALRALATPGIRSFARASGEDEISWFMNGPCLWHKNI